MDSQTTQPGDDLESIAIIGIALKFPQGATSEKSFWDALLDARCLSTKIPSQRMQAASFYHQDQARTDTTVCLHGHFLEEDVAAFDAPFFSIGENEAAGLDPQQRLLLEASYRAIESAGIPIGKVSHSKTSVYSASFTDDYKSINAKDPENGSNYGANGLSPNMLANRISWFYNLHGASFNVDSACSSSLMALDIACQGLRNGDANMSLVAGSNLILNIDWMLLLSKMSFLSPDGKCFSFDQRGNGYGRGEGVSVLVLKRVSDAIRDGDPIRAVIRSSGSNSDGRTSQITQPSPEAQESLIRDTYAKANLDMSLTRFVEAHGTGTYVGDPIEAAAIGACFKKFRSSDQPLFVGAVKSIIGHLEGCSGLGGIIKTVLILEKGLITPNANFEKLNNNIDQEFYNLEFPTTAIPWPGNGLRRASVNSFGFGGSNSHIVLDDAYNYLRARGLRGHHWTAVHPPILDTLQSLPCSDEGYKTQSSDDGSVLKNHPPVLLTWSAFDEKALKMTVHQYEQHRYNNPSSMMGVNNQLESLALTLNSRRTKFQCRTWALVSSIREMGSLQSLLSPIQTCSSDPRLGFVFTGQGAQWFAMGRELLSFPLFKESIMTFSKHLQGIGCQWSLMDQLLREKSSSSISKPEFSQPICTAVQIAVVDLLKYFGVVPAVCVGHSSGEIAAAYTIGAISARSACQISYFRGLLSSQLATSGGDSLGGMMAVGLCEKEVIPYLQKVSKEKGRDGLVVACMNSPKSTTVSGTRDDIIYLKELLDEHAVFSRVLDVPVAYHSPMMNAVADEYLNLIGDLKPDAAESNPSIEMISSLTGSRISAQELCSGEYWVANMVSPVNFEKALSNFRVYTGKFKKKLNRTHLDLAHVNDLVEIGPHSALQGPIRDTLATNVGSSNIRYLATLVRNRNALITILTAMGSLYSLGYPVNLCRVNQMDHRFDLKPLMELPEYPFDHSKSYWSESRLSKGLRLRKVAKNDLLGTPVADWNPSEARWRNFVKVSELPWAADHKIGGSILYPGAGMLCMAIEAAHQLADHSRRIRGFILKDSTFIAPMIIPDTPEGLEIQCFLQPLGGVSAAWYEFKISAFLGQWNEVCRGNIQVEYEIPNSPSSWKNQNSANNQAHSDDLENIKSCCPNIVLSTDLFKLLSEVGYEYGKSFQRFGKILAGDDYVAFADIDIYQEYQEPHIMHPTTLDGVFQLAFAALTKGCQEKLDMSLPNRVHSMWISKKGLSNTQNCLQATARAQSDGYNSKFALRVMDENVKTLLLHIEGLEMTKLSQTLAGKLRPAPRICHEVSWKPDLDLLNSTELFEFCQELPKDGEPIPFYQELTILLHASMQKHLALQDLHSDPTKPHLRRYEEWMARAVRSFEEHSTPAKITAWKELIKHEIPFKQACERIRNANRQGPLYVAVAESLSDIMCGKLDILSLLFGGTLATDFYEDMNESPNCIPQLARYLDAAVHKNPGMKVLEIGAGTGGSTDMIMRTLITKDLEKRYETYDFTDISASFFENAREKFARFPNMNFLTFNIELDAESQGFEEASYDLIIAANVLHATKDIGATIKNTRKLLKSSGKLILYEVTSPETIYANFVFGLLPGWWLGAEDFRQWSPFITTERWHQVLTEHGFSGTDLILSDYENEECRSCSVIITTATSEKKTTTIPKLTLVVSDTPSEIEKAVAAELKNVLIDGGCSGCETSKISDLTSTVYRSGLFHIFLVDLGRSHLSQLTPEILVILQKTLDLTKGILWVGCNKNPDYAMADGLSKTARNEYLGLKFSTLALETSYSDPFQIAKKIHDILHETLCQDIYAGELTYNQKNGRLQIPRLVESSRLSLEINQGSLDTIKTTKRLDACAPLKLIMGTPGRVNSLCLTEIAEFDQPLQESEVEIEVKAIGIDSRDRQIALGKERGILAGSELSGIVRRVGANADFQLGDQVCGNVEHAFTTYARSKTSTIVPIPDGMTFVEAASFASAFGMAYHSLVHIARIKQDETVLIHSGASITGQAAIQIAIAFGAIVYTTIATDDEMTLLTKRYALLSKNIFVNRDSSYVAGVLRATNGKGFDVILDSSTRENFAASIDCIRRHGRFVGIEAQESQSNDQLPKLSSAKNLTFCTVDYTSLIKERPLLVKESLEGVSRLLQERKIRLAMDLSIYKLSEIKQAFGETLDHLQTQKTVIEVVKSDNIEAEFRNMPSFRFRSDRTYIIAGGLGGVGRTMARWFVSNGAANLILLSRSGAASAEARRLIDELKNKGVNVYTPLCDISDKSALQSVLESASPPIAGCIQSSMVLKDSLFENMRHEDWKLATSPKVQGSWNLHSLLFKNLDFFIMLSSLSGVVGVPGQANYSAGNNYQDALARFRISQGLKAVSIDLGAMLSSGLLSENQKLLNKWISETAFVPITDANLFALLSHYCNSELPILTESTCQVAVGLATPASLHNGRIDQPPWMARSLFSHLHQVPDYSSPSDLSKSQKNKNITDITTAFKKVATLWEAGAIATRALAEKLGNNTSGGNIDTDKPMVQYGVDSLLVVELRSWVMERFGADVQGFEILSGASCAEVGLLIARKSKFVKETWVSG